MGVLGRPCQWARIARRYGAAGLGSPTRARASSQISKAVLSAPDGWADAWQDARIEAAKETGGEIQRFPAACPWTVEQVLGEGWLPE